MARDILSAFRGCPVLVVGDLILDEYLWGHVSRISPEAPVPVVEVRRQSAVPGGAANAAANVAALGGRPVLVGAAGADPEGDRLCELLAALDVNADPVVRDTSRPTATKTRVVAHTQQVVRIDRERPGPIPSFLEESLLAAAEAQLPSVRGCVISDYGKGVVTPALCARLTAAGRAAGVPVVIDPYGTDYPRYRGATVVKPNQLEAGRALHRDLRTDADVVRAGGDLLAMLGPGTAVLVTRGPEGMTLFEPGRGPDHIPVRPREVYDVTGAGDTVAGVLVLALAAGVDLPTACRLADLAAGVVIGKVGTATCSLDELRAAVASVGL